jgi:hypothetical protein
MFCCGQAAVFQIIVQDGQPGENKKEIPKTS